MVELLFACKRESDRPRLEIKYKIGVSDPYHFIDSSVSRQLDLIEDCVEYRKGVRHTDDEDKYWMDTLKQDAGLQLALFI